MVCKNCGKQVSRKDKFCAGCATPVPEDTGNAVRRGWHGFRGWRTRRQVASWVVAAFVGLIILGALAGNSGAKTAAMAPTSSAPTPTTSEPPATTTATTPPPPSGPTASDISATVARVLNNKFTRVVSDVECSGAAKHWRCTDNAVMSVYGDPDFTVAARGHDAYRISTSLAKQLGAKVAAAHAKYAAKQRAIAKAKAKARAAYMAKQKAIARAKAALAKIGTPVARQQAIDSAESYLQMGGFSRAKLIEQLSSSYGEGFSLALATWAVDRVHADWNEQAVESARGYLQMGGFSRDGLIQQLTSSYGEGFTYDQAVYAVNKVGL
jgi:hypothetical protein